MTHLSVNVNKLATLRNSRGKNRPNVAEFAEKILALGVAGITVHPRPDGRHIRTHDVEEIHALIRSWNHDNPDQQAEFNVEGFPSADFISLVARYRPHQVTLVPDPPDAITSNAGWDLERHEEFLTNTARELERLGIRVSLFVDPFTFTAEQEAALTRIHPGRIELYTEKYADAFATDSRSAVTSRYKIVAAIARKHGIGVNAGHDLSQENVGYLVTEIPWIDEVSIGHALFCEAIEQGLATSVRNYLHILNLNVPVASPSADVAAVFHAPRA